MEYFKVELRRIEHTITLVLMHNTQHTNTGIPIPPLLKLIAEYTAPVFDGGTVTTEVGQDSSGFVDGDRSVACFINPVHIVPYCGPIGNHRPSYLIADSTNYAIRQYIPSSKGCETDAECVRTVVCGESTPREVSPAFQHVQSIALDPTNTSVLYFCDNFSIHRLDCWRNGTARAILLAGASQMPGDFVDNTKTGYSARFDTLSAVLCSADGKTIYASDSLNKRIRSIDTETGATTTCIGDGTNLTVDRLTEMVLGIGTTKGMAWNTLSTVPEFFVICSYDYSILRCQPSTRTCTRLSMFRPADQHWSFSGLTCMSNGLLLINVACFVYAFDPITGDTRRVAGHSDGWLGSSNGDALTQARFRNNVGLLCLENEFSALICDRYGVRPGTLHMLDCLHFVPCSGNHSIRRVTLPPCVVDWTPGSKLPPLPPCAIDWTSL